ncbi:hypothetical protein AAG747_09490 [Rapidithrix thailandica]|uniref:Uncharacterized protein n=2 Tax=Rapidithrix thailandica TaxID=413964 RepID=A0AAW9S6U9_9BACT
MIKVKEYLVAGDKAKAINYLCENGCDINTAHNLVKKIADKEDYLDNYMLDCLLELLPGKKLEAAKLIKYFYDIRISYAKRVVDFMVDAPDITRDIGRKALKLLNPNRRQDDTPPYQNPMGDLNARLLQMAVEGNNQAACSLLVEKLNFQPIEAEEYIQELKGDIRRPD